MLKIDDGLLKFKSPRLWGFVALITNYPMPEKIVNFILQTDTACLIAHKVGEPYSPALHR